MEPPQADTTWQEIEPQLDDAMHSLGEADRAALLLRYFEHKSLREVGAALGVSDDTAQKRITRALERLRKTFAQDGVALSVAALTATLPARAVESAPHALAHSVAHASISSTTISTTTTLLVKGTLQMIIWSKWKFALGLAIVLILAAGTATVLTQRKTPAVAAAPAAPTAEDRTTPLGALRFLAVALDNFDATNVAACLYAQSPTQERFMAAMVGVVRSEGAMRQALEKQFGTNGVDALPKRPMFAMSFGQDNLAAAEFEVQGTNAIVRTPGRDDRSDEMRLVQIGGVWKVGGDKGDSPQAIKGVESMERMSSALDSFTTSITSGEFPTAEEALRAMRTRVGSAMRTKPNQ